MKKLFFFVSLILSVSFVSAQTEITLDDIFRQGKFQAQQVYGIVSMNDGENYTSLNMGRNSISRYSYRTGEQIETLFRCKDVKEVEIPYIFEYEFNHDESLLLISTNYEPIYRHSYKADFFVYDMKSKAISPLSENGAQQLACFSPDGSMISFVRDNNIYIKNLADGSEKAITNDGEWNHIINGAPDWVYEEEFSFHKGYEWSPDGKYIAFMKTDESKVKMFSIDMYGTLYPEKYEYKYPKVGEENSNVDVYVYQLEGGKTVQMNIPDRGDDYIPRIKWTNTSNLLSIIHLDRLQQNYRLFWANAQTGYCDLVYYYTEKKYLEINDDLTFLSDGKRFLLTHELDGYKHIYLFDIGGRLINQVTKGNWEVTAVYGYDEKSGRLYYQSCEESPLYRGVYSIKLDGSEKKLLSPKTGTNQAEFNANFTYFINTYSDANTPYLVSLINSDGKSIREIETNKSLRLKVNETVKFTQKEFFNFTTDNGDMLNGWMIKPPKFNPKKKYPVLVYVYGGPGHQTVTDEWDYNMAWWQLLAQKGYIVVSVDNRGTGGRGKDFRQVTYGQLGKYETIDQIEAAKWLMKQKYIDGSRIGIFGWSYGGYMTALCMTIGADYFKAGVAVALVSNWRYYDSIYTERYNGLPDTNAAGYDDNSPINHVSKLKGKFLLVHGMADDNVHFQNAVELTNKLIAEDKQFEVMYYPNRNHGIYGGNTRMHLYTMMTDFIIKNL